MKALKIALLALGLCWLNKAYAQTDNLGVTATANVGGAVQWNGSSIRLYDPTTNAWRWATSDSSGNLNIAGTFNAATSTTSYESLSRPTVTLTTAYSVLLTSAAGVSGPCEFCISAVGSNNFYYGWSNSATPPGFGAMFSLSTTPICKNNLYPNTFLHLSVTGAALSATVQVNISVKH